MQIFLSDSYDLSDYTVQLLTVFVLAPERISSLAFSTCPCFNASVSGDLTEISKLQSRYIKFIE